jgi:predicted Fe-S protein YdhL (DUF1289 family)
MVPMYCVGCRRTRMVYRTWTVTNADGASTVIGACPACGKQLTTVLPKQAEQQAPP